MANIQAGEKDHQLLIIKEAKIMNYTCWQLALTE